MIRGYAGSGREGVRKRAHACWARRGASTSRFRTLCASVIRENFDRGTFQSLGTSPGAATTASGE